MLVTKSTRSSWSASQRDCRSSCRRQRLVLLHLLKAGNQLLDPNIVRSDIGHSGFLVGIPVRKIPLQLVLAFQFLKTSLESCQRIRHFEAARLFE
jgi:hypothetical protein